MTNQEAIRILDEQRNKFMDEWVDFGGVNEAYNIAIQALKEQEAKTGHWIDTTNIIGFPRCECSVCNSEAGAIWMKYCPNCGAKMEGR